MKKLFAIILGLLIISTISTSIVIGHSPVKNFKVSNISTDSENDQERYAVIMIGRFIGSISDIRTVHERHYTWYLKAAALTYNMLKYTYGYDDDHIFLLVKTIPIFSTPDSFKEIEHLIDYSPSKENLELVINKFKENGNLELDDTDSLFLCLINHGGVYNDINGNEGAINWMSPDIFDGSAWDFEQLTYDENVKTCAVFDEPVEELEEEGYSDWMTLMVDNTTKLRGFKIKTNNYYDDESLIFDQMQLSFYNDETLLKVTDITNWPNAEKNRESAQTWLYHRFEGANESLPVINKVKIRFHKIKDSTGFDQYPAKVFEFDLWPGNAGYDMKNCYMGCPYLSIPDYLKTFFDPSDTEIYDWELENYVENINAKMIFLLQPCFSGGFIDNLSGENRIICTSSRGNEPSDCWVEIFIHALNKDYNGVDLNDDDKISILEAYEYTAKEDYNRYQDLFHPLIDDDGIYPGHRYTEPDYVKEGDIAGQTFLDYEGDLKAIAFGPYSSKPNEIIEFKGLAIGGSRPYSYHWDFGDDVTSTLQNPTHSYNNSKTYSVTLTVTDNAENTDSVIVNAEITKAKSKNLPRFVIFEKFLSNFPFLSFILKNHFKV